MSTETTTEAVRICECGSLTKYPCRRKAVGLYIAKGGASIHMCIKHATMNLSQGGYKRIPCQCHAEVSK